MEGSGYWVIIALFYLLSMWLKKRRQAERRRQFEAGEDGTIEPVSQPRPPQSDFLSNLLRDAGFDFDKEEEDEVPDVEPEGAAYVPASETIRERMVEFDQDAVDIESPMTQHDDGRIVKQAHRTRAYDTKSADYRRLIPDLDDIDDLREAIILKEILDKPRALRRRIR